MLDINAKMSFHNEKLIVFGLLFIAIPSPPHITEIAFAKGSLSPTIHWHSLDNMETLKPVLRFKRSGVSDWVRAACQMITPHDYISKHLIHILCISD